MLKFFYNGIKVDGGKLQSASYSQGGWTKLPEETITIYFDSYSFPEQEIRDAFPCENKTDSMSDYFEKSTARVLPSNPYYAQVKAALDAQTAKGKARKEARIARWNAKLLAA